jgi:hypothetical protein
VLIPCPRCDGLSAGTYPSCAHCGGELGNVKSRKEIPQYPPGQPYRTPALWEELWLPGLLVGLLGLWLYLRG